MTRSLDGIAPCMVCALSPLGRDNLSCTLYTECVHPKVSSLCPQGLLLCLLPDPPLRTPPTRITLLKVGVLVMEALRWVPAQPGPTIG